MVSWAGQRDANVTFVAVHREVKGSGHVSFERSAATRLVTFRNVQSAGLAGTACTVRCGKHSIDRIVNILSIWRGKGGGPEG